MLSTRKITPAPQGVQRLRQQSCAQHIGACYRDDKPRGKRYKTIELILEELPYAPLTPQLKPETLVRIDIGLSEVALRKKAKQVGGSWNRARPIWERRYGKAVELGLVDRIVDEDRSISRSSTTSRK